MALGHNFYPPPPPPKFYGNVWLSAGGAGAVLELTANSEWSANNFVWVRDGVEGRAGDFTFGKPLKMAFPRGVGHCGGGGQDNVFKDGRGAV